VGWLDASLFEADGDAADLLDRPTDEPAVFTLGRIDAVSGDVR
jgi:hypothetical protein